MKGFVVDASVAMAWVHPAQATNSSKTLLDEVHDGALLEAPALWPLEVSNALIVLVRRRKLLESDRKSALAALQKLSVKIDHEMAGLAFTKISALAVEYAVSAYDATYLELAHRRKLPLACKDGPLREAARRVGVKVL